MNALRHFTVEAKLLRFSLPAYDTGETS